MAPRLWPSAYGEGNGKKFLIGVQKQKKVKSVKTIFGYFSFSKLKKSIIHYGWWIGPWLWLSLPKILGENQNHSQELEVEPRDRLYLLVSSEAALSINIYFCSVANDLWEAPVRNKQLNFGHCPNRLDPPPVSLDMFKELFFSTLFLIR